MKKITKTYKGYKYTFIQEPKEDFDSYNIKEIKTGKIIASGIAPKGNSYYKFEEFKYDYNVGKNDKQITVEAPLSDTEKNIWGYEVFKIPKYLKDLYVGIVGNPTKIRKTKGYLTPTSNTKTYDETKWVATLSYSSKNPKIIKLIKKKYFK